MMGWLKILAKGDGNYCPFSGNAIELNVNGRFRNQFGRLKLYIFSIRSPLAIGRTLITITPCLLKTHYNITGCVTACGGLWRWSLIATFNERHQFGSGRILAVVMAAGRNGRRIVFLVWGAIRGHCVARSSVKRPHTQSLQLSSTIVCKTPSGR